MKKAFTLIELAVAVAILGIVMVMAGAIFKVSIASQRTAAANAEIMRKLRAITEQLDADFEGLIRTIPGRTDIETGGGDPNKNADRIAFLAQGDFQSTMQYGSSPRTVVGNVASIFYGQAADPYPDTDPNIDPFIGDPKQKILVRRQTILTSDSDPGLPDSQPWDEYFKISLAQWRLDPPFDEESDWTARPSVDLDDPNDLVMYMARGVDNFTIDLFAGFEPEGGIRWSRADSDQVSTRAFRFTFTLYDSKGIIKNGRTFTHIVYLDD